MWKIRGVVSKGQYNYAIVPGHPNATKNGYVLEHRIVVENSLGYILPRSTLVHHKDENKKNNHIDNLEPVSAKEHRSRHTNGITRISCVCHNCGKEFERNTSNVHGGKTFCSRSCNGSFQRKGGWKPK